MLYFIRLFRFTLDGLLTGQAVLTVFFGVTDQEAVYIALSAVMIPLTALAKILGTRLWKSQVRALEDDEANALCGIDVEPSWVRAHETIRGSDMHQEGPSIPPHHVFYHSDARASGRYPTIVTPSATRSGIYRVLQRLHSSFHANGNDGQPYATQHGGVNRSISNPFRRGAKTVFKAPAQIASKAAGNAKQYSEAFQSQADDHRLNRKEKKDAAREEKDLANKNKENVLAMLSVDKGLSSHIKRTRSTQLNRQRSARSDEQPFLSGMDSLSAHAPQGSGENGLPSDHDGEMSFEEVAGLTRSRSARSQEVVMMEPREPAIAESAEDTSPATSSQDVVEKRSLKKITSGSASEDHGDESGPLVLPHPGVSWEDHPNHLARYNNPFYNAVLDPFLWLPRRPEKTLDLCDTIEWYGSALVSSQGGKGMVGEWDDSDDEGDDAYDEDGGLVKLEDVDGGEMIQLPGALARRLQDVEEVDETPDPATSLPKTVLADYRKAIGRDGANSDSGGSVKMSDLLRTSDSLRSPPGSPILEGRRPSSPEQGRFRNRLPSVSERMTYPGPTESTPDVAGHATEGRLQKKPSQGQVAFAEERHHRYPSGRVHGSHSRRVTNASYMSHGTVVSAMSSQGGKSITMRKALQAEVLEEERRATIGKRLAKKQQKASKKKEVHDEEAVEVEDGAMNRQK